MNPIVNEKKIMNYVLKQTWFGELPQKNMAWKAIAWPRPSTRGISLLWPRSKAYMPG
jgi:hypothetical protein